MTYLVEHLQLSLVNFQVSVTLEVNKTITEGKSYSYLYPYLVYDIEDNLARLDLYRPSGRTDRYVPNYVVIL